jgi:hypothetical protein
LSPNQLSKSDSTSVDDDELQKIIESSNNRKNVKYEIKIDAKLKMDFDINDEIFALTEKVGTKIRSNNCNSCQKVISDKIE